MSRGSRRSWLLLHVAVAVVYVATVSTPNSPATLGRSVFPSLLAVSAEEVEVGADGSTADATTTKLREEIGNLIRQNAALTVRAQMAEQKYRDLQQRASKVAESSASPSSSGGECNCAPRPPREIDPSKASNHHLRDEVDALYEAELERQVRADTRATTPRRLSTCEHCPDCWEQTKKQRNKATKKQNRTKQNNTKQHNN